MKFTFKNTVHKFDGQTNGHLTVTANGLFEAIELLKCMVAIPEHWDLESYG